MTLQVGAVGAADDALTKKISALLAEPVAQGQVASLSVSVRSHGEVLFSGSAGFADLEQKVAATPEGLYGIGSISKSLTAYTVLTLVSQGKLHLADRLSTLLPDYRGAGGEATVLQLLTHTGGIADYAGNSAPDRILDPARHYTEADVVSLFEHEPASFAPGTHWQYSNSGYYLLGLIIEKATGRPYTQVVQELLLSPLGLPNIKMAFYAPLMTNRVRGYTHGTDGALQNASSYDATIALAAGGYQSTAGELTSYIERLFSARVPRVVHDLMFAEVPLNDGTPISYLPTALIRGDLQGHERYYHAGGIWGFAAFVSYLPAEQLAIGVLTNTDNGAVSLAHLDQQIARLVLGLEEPAIVDRPLPAAQGKRYAGTYCLRHFLMGNGEARLALVDKSLTLTMDSPAALSRGVRLLYQGDGRFAVAETDGLAVRFTTEKDAALMLSVDTPLVGTLAGKRCTK